MMIDLTKLDFVSEKEVDKDTYTLYHFDEGDPLGGFTHYYFITKNGNPQDVKQIAGPALIDLPIPVDTVPVGGIKGTGGVETTHNEASSAVDSWADPEALWA